jgi:uncharacterized membrane protein YgaE (UPF0421/DUF939 family)
MARLTRKSLTFLLMPDEHRKLQEAAEKLNINMADIIRMFIRKLPSTEEELVDWVKGD